MAPGRGWALQVAHVNHLLRGPDSDGDEDFVRSLSASLGLPFHLLRADVGALAAGEGQSIETAARAVRYRFFERLSGELEAGKAGGAPAVLFVSQSHTTGKTRRKPS
jgi:tRNA(Ile)-lysidine synthase